MAGERIVIFESKFETDASTPGELADAYPFIRADEPEILSVKSGALRVERESLGGENQVNELCEGLENCMDVAYHISITWDADLHNMWLGCYVGEGNARNRFAFHPGKVPREMFSPGGQFRIEGPGGCGNVNIGFTPSGSYEASCRFVVVLNRDGNHEVTIGQLHDEYARPCMAMQRSYTKKWSNPELWTENMVKSPPFGVNFCEAWSRGCVFYRDFAVSSATAQVRVLTLGSQQLENSLMMLTFTGLAGDVVQTMEVDPTSSVEDLYASLAKVLPGPIKLIRPDASVLDRTAGKSTLEAALGWAPQRGGGSSAEAPRSGGGDRRRRAPRPWSTPCCPLA